MKQYKITITSGDYPLSFTCDTIADAYECLCTFARRAPSCITLDRDALMDLKWAVNNCDAEIAEDTARIKVCEEWGFEASRIKIIGTPYYDATDWQFIRFDCAHMTWLWRNGNLHQVYE